MADNDSQIDLKKRARRRLVGSAALALAAAIVLPMVMDHEPRPPSQDVQIRIPSQEGSNFTSRVINGKAPAPAQPLAAAPVDDSTAPEVDDGARARLGPEPGSPVFKPGEELIPPSRKGEPAKADIARPDARKPEPKPDPKPDPKLKEKEREKEKAREQEKEREKEREKQRERDKEREREKAKADAEREKARAEAERAKALLAGASPKEEAGATKPHVVGLGAYREEGNVAILRAKLKAEGYPSYTEKLGDKIRVRAGPFPNKAAADKAAARIQKVLGVSASVAAKP